MDFSKQELEIIASGMDMIIRSEGQAMSQVGIMGLQGGKTSVLAERLILAGKVHSTVAQELADLAEAEKAAADMNPAAGG